MIFKFVLYLSLAFFMIGLLYRVSTWFRFSFEPERGASKPLKRLSAALKGLPLTLCSRKGLTLTRVFVREVLFQKRTWRESSFRGAMHGCIFWGFWVLFFMHALERFVPSAFFRDYASTLNPFLFLRDLFGLAMLIGIAMAVYRRFIRKPLRLLSNGMDKITLLMLLVILLSGFLLEATKIISYRSFKGMAEDYASAYNESELKSLESYWAANFGVVAPGIKGPFSPELQAQGKEIHEASCANCHSAAQWAFAGYTLSRAVSPLAGPVDRSGVPVFLWYVHFLTCFAALAYLPFSRMFHIFTTPLSLLANAVMTREHSDPLNLITKQIVELDACTHCGTCSALCSVGVWSDGVGNPLVLPSEKIAALQKIAGGGKAPTLIQNGLSLCTNCHRCTEVCPAGINLQELWFGAREIALGRGATELSILSPLSYYRALRIEEIPPRSRPGAWSSAQEAMERVFKDPECLGEPIEVRRADKAFKQSLEFSKWTQGSSSYCFTCMTCSSVCPVVRSCSDPAAALGLTPHQIIHAANLGLPEMVFRSPMLWACTGCYQCQEACPQGVRVADVFYRLKNMAAERIDMKETRSPK